MVLYGEDGRAQFFSLDEVTKIWTDYEEFSVRREAFKENPNIQAHILLEEIQKIKRIPLELRLSLPNYFNIKDRELTKLEEECRKY